MKRISPSSRRVTAFTLLEMMITMGIFILLAGAVFGIITAVLQSASSLQDNQNRQDQIMALHAFLTNKLTTLPAKGVLVSYKRGDGEGLVQNGIIFGQVGLLRAIDAKVQPNGYYTLRHASFSGTGTDVDKLLSQQLNEFELAVTSDDPTLNWSPLIPDVKSIDWKFQTVNQTDWDEVWSNTGGKPNLIELSMQIAGDLQTNTTDYWIPPVEQVNLSVPQTTTTNAH